MGDSTIRIYKRKNEAGEFLWLYLSNEGGCHRSGEGRYRGAARVGSQEVAPQVVSVGTGAVTVSAS